MKDLVSIVVMNMIMRIVVKCSIHLWAGTFHPVKLKP